jgi:phosphatidylglycerol:prolipoprotein diacylglycerol transferase
MLKYPQIDPVALHLGPLQIHWYGVMYLVAFVTCWGIVTLRVKNSKRGFTPEQISDILFYVAMGVIIGGRVGYMIFYARNDLIANPLQLFEVWKGGMSFHGGLIGVILSLWIYAKQNKKDLVDITDLVAPSIPLGLAVGRLGNFINGELWGKVTHVPWAMVFPNGGPYPRHPSQLYEFLLEGLLSFAILWIYSMKIRPRWAVSGLFLILYGSFRFFIEFFREPDPQIGYIAFGWLTEGQLLSIPMIILGLALFIYAYRRRK